MKILAYGVRGYERPLLEKAFAGHSLHSVEWECDEDTAPLAQGYEGISSTPDSPLTAAVLDRLARGGTRFVTQRSTGFNNIDLSAAERLGFWVTRVAGYSPYSVAEFAWTLAQTLNRKSHRAWQRTREFDFRLDGLMGRDVHGSTVGVVGTGRIGLAFARIAAGYGTRLLGWDVNESADCRDLGMRYMELPDLLSQADLVSLHVPLSPATYHLIDGSALALMREEALLVNTGRGGLIDTAALVDALRERQIGGVALDVYEEEEGVFYRDLSSEVITDDVLARLMSFPNVIVTSHQAFFTREAVETLMATTVRNVADYLARNVTVNTLIHP